MIVTAAGIVSVPVLYVMNKQRTDLGLEPYPYSSVFEGIFRLFQMLASKVRFFKRNCNLSYINDERIAEIVRDWDEEALDALEARVQFFTERETDEESISDGSELDVCSQVSWETETEEQTPEDVGYRNEQGGITPETRVHVPLRRETPDEEHKGSVWSFSDSHSQVFSKTEPNEVKVNIVRECGGKSGDTNDADVQVSMSKENKETVVNVIDEREESFSTRTTNTQRAHAQFPLEKEKDKETIKNVRDFDKKSVSTHEPRAQVSTTKIETGEGIVKNIGGWDEENKTTHNARAADSMEKGETTGKETVQNVEDWSEKNVTMQKSRDQVFIESGSGEKTEEIEKDLDKRSENTHNASARVSMENETGEGSTRDWDEETITEKENHKGNVGSVRIWDERAQTSIQVILEKELTASSTEFQVTDDEPGSSIPIPPSAFTYYDESQDSNEADVNTVILQEILRAGQENKDPNDIENQNSAEDNETAGTWQLINGREALSDEENIYGRQDIQCIAPKKAISSTFCCANGRDETFPESGKRRDFVRFSGSFPLTQLQHHDEADLKGDSMEQQVENSEASVMGTQIQGALLGQEMEKSPEKESKKGKRRRRRRNNKRIDSLATSEADDELDKDELEQETWKTSKKAKDGDKTKRKATDLQSKTVTPKTGKQPAQEKNEKEAKNAEVSAEKTIGKKVNLKKKDKAKKESPTQNDVTPGKRKTKFFRFLMRKNTSDSQYCDVTKENSTDLKGGDETRKNATVPKDSGVTIKKTADPKECDVIRKNTADLKNSDVPQNTSAYPTKKKTADPKHCDITRKNTADPKNSDATKKNAAYATKKNSADPKDCYQQKKSKTSLSRSLSVSSVGSSKSVGVEAGSVAKITPATNVQAEEEKDRDVLSLYDDID